MKLIKFYRHTEQKERNITSIYTMLPWILRKREKSVNIAHVQCVTKHTFMSMYLVVGSSANHRYKFFVRPKGIFIYFFIIIKVSKLKQFTNKLCRLPHHWLFCVCEWSFWCAHFVHYIATSSLICIWSMMKLKMLAYFTSATTKRFFKRLHVILFVQCIICLHETIHFRLFNPQH